jgi:hypothetical protein
LVAVDEGLGGESVGFGKVLLDITGRMVRDLNAQRVDIRSSTEHVLVIERRHVDGMCDPERTKLSLILPILQGSKVQSAGQQFRQWGYSHWLM